MSDRDENGWLIHKAGRGWYRPDASGYTSNPDEAERYTHADAWNHSHPNGTSAPPDGVTIKHESEITREPKTYTEAEVRAMVAAAVMEAAEWLQGQCLTEDELRQGYLFTAEYPAKAADTIRDMLIRPDAMSALEAYRDREVAKALERAAAKQDARCAYWVARLEGGLPKKSVAATQGRVAGHYTAAEDIRAMISEVKP